MRSGRNLALISFACVKRKLDAHAHNIALHNMIFALPFAYTSAILAAGGHPSLHDIFWITMVIVGARSAAMAMDNLIDLKFDRQQARMAQRPMVTGIISVREAKLLIAGCLILFVVSVLQLQPICIWLMPVAAFPFLIYPYMKRVTWACHLVLGIAISMAPAGGWVAVRGDITLPMALLCLAVCLWISAFDVVYGCQDEAFDREHQLHSMAERFTAAGALLIARCVHVLSILCFLGVGMLLGLGGFYFIGVVIAALTLIYQHRIVSSDDFSRVTKNYFLRNGIVSIAMFVFTWLSLV